jgi:hypothetical protein
LKRKWLILILLLAEVFANGQTSPARDTAVLADDYSSFWIWGGVRPQPVLSRAETLYILQGNIIEKRGDGATRVLVQAQGMPVARLRKGRVWLVFRVNTLRWSSATVGVLVSRLEQWQTAGNPVTGLQIDFDVKTRRLPEYVEYLKKLRAGLPERFGLSITGLLDWSANGDIDSINRLKGVVDEVTVQTYQGKKTIANYQDYLPALKRLSLPFKIGLIQNGRWEAPEGFESNPWFRGYVVFLRNLPET